MKLILISALIITLVISLTSHAYAQRDIPSPLKQFQSGTLTEDVKCSDGFQLIGKRQDGSPACVTPDTFSRLISLAWGYDPVHEWSFVGLKDTYKAGQDINFGMKLKAYAGIICGFPTVVAKYENQTVWQSNSVTVSCRPSIKEDFSFKEYAWYLGPNTDLGIMVLKQVGTYSIVVTWFKSSDVLIQKNITITS
jgi:hypothetical protein